jgi:hypothetical protein
MGCQKQCSACGVTYNSSEDKVETLPGEKNLCGLPECRLKSMGGKNEINNR